MRERSLLGVMVLCFWVQRDKESLVKKKNTHTHKRKKIEAHFVDMVWRRFQRETEVVN